MSNNRYGLVFKEHEEKIPDGVYFKEDKELRLDYGGHDNIIIEGENLMALSLLKKDYRSKVDVICIDPPIIPAWIG